MSHFQAMEERCVCDGITSPSPSLEGLSVFLAEDEFINQHMISSFLKEKGALVNLYENGQELLLALENSWPDVILTDIKMPVMGGLEAVREIRKSERYLDKGRIPVIAITAHDVQGYDVTCFTAGMDEYLTKPLDLDRLTTTILSLCEGGGSMTK